MQCAFPNGSLPVLVSPLPIATAEHGRLLYSRVVTPAPSDAFAFSIAQIEIATLVPSGLAIDANGWTKLLTVLQGTIEEMVWAPDGAMLAFTNVRGDHGFLGVVAFANATTLLSDAIAWVAPSHDTDAGPRWSHDGTRLAWRRERDMVGVDGRDQRCVKGGYCGRTGAAYSLMVASVRKEDEASAVVSVADVRTLFSDFITGWANGEAGYGSRPMDWSADGSELFFPCETSGYVHVAAVAVPLPASSAVKHAVKLQKLPRDLTSLPCDNQAWSLHTSTAKRTAQTLYVVHNCDNVDSMGIAAIDVVTGKRTVVIAAAPTRVVGMTTTLGLAHVDAGLIFVETTWSNSTVLRLLPTGAPAGSLGTLLTPSPPLHALTALPSSPPPSSPSLRTTASLCTLSSSSRLRLRGGATPRRGLRLSLRTEDRSARCTHRFTLESATRSSTRSISISPRSVSSSSPLTTGATSFLVYT